MSDDEALKQAWDTVRFVAEQFGVATPKDSPDTVARLICAALSSPKIQDVLQEGIGSTYISLHPGMKFKMVTLNGLDCRLFEVKTVRKRDVVVRALPLIVTRSPLNDENAQNSAATEQNSARGRAAARHSVAVDPED